jgi:hypothetical protein
MRGTTEPCRALTKRERRSSTGKIRFKPGAEVSTLLRPHYPHLILGTILPIDATDTCVPTKYLVARASATQPIGFGHAGSIRSLPISEKTRRSWVLAHGNSLRALIKHLDCISDRAISEVEIPMGVPLIYNLNANIVPLEKYYLRSNARSATTGVPASAAEIAVH